MKIIQTAEMTPGSLDPDTQYAVYNGLDCCLTHEIFETLDQKIQPGANAPSHATSYDFVRAMQGPALEMMLTGLRVDIVARDAAVRHLESETEILSSLLNDLARAVWDKGLNAKSSQQKCEILYGVMMLPEQTKRNKSTGQMARTADRAALEKLLEAYPIPAGPMIRAILAIQDRAKQISILRSEVDADSRMRTSYNVAGTETARWSSSANAFGTGTNLQNIPDKLRRIFIADPGRKIAYLDLEQAESRAVGIKCFSLFGATNYIDACESGDLHTTTCKMVWDELPWTGDPRADRKIAERIFYRDYSYRDMSKRGGHGTNYFGKDYTMAKHLKVETKLITEFQQRYFRAFPEIRHWHSWVGQELQLSQRLVTTLGRPRDFFGRPNDDTTLREAIAFEPQSVVGELLNLAAWRVWKRARHLGVRLLAQLHDAILIDYPDDPRRESDIIAEVSDLMRTPLIFEGRTFVIGNDAATGWNWGKFNDDPRKGPLNLGGIRGFKLGSVDERKRPATSGLDRVIPSFH